MVNSYYGIYQAERGKTAAEIRADGRVPGRTGRRMRAGRSPLTAVPQPRENGEQEMMAPCSGAVPPSAGRTLRG